MTPSLGLPGGRRERATGGLCRGRRFPGGPFPGPACFSSSSGIKPLPDPRLSFGGGLSSWAPRRKVVWTFC